MFYQLQMPLISVTQLIFKTASNHFLWLNISAFDIYRQLSKAYRVAIEVALKSITEYASSLSVNEVCKSIILPAGTH